MATLAGSSRTIWNVGRRRRRAIERARVRRRVSRLAPLFDKRVVGTAMALSATVGYRGARVGNRRRRHLAARWGLDVRQACAMAALALHVVVSRVSNCGITDTFIGG